MRISNFGAQPQSEVVSATDVAPVQRDERVFLDFNEDKVQTLTLNQLARTVKENRGDDGSQPHGIYHFALIQKMLDMAAEAGYDAEVYDLFATNNRDKQTPGVSLNPELEEKYGPRAVEAHTIRRVYANIRLKNFDDGETTTNMALAYTQRGIQVGIGTNVMVCHNQTMLGQGNFVSDYNAAYHYASGDTYVMPLSGIIQTIGTWLTNLEHIVVTDRETIQRMKETVISADDIYKILGLLLQMRVSSDTSVKRIRYNGPVYPLNQTQLNMFTESLLVKMHDEGRITAWSMYNCATDIYKPQTAETNKILPQNLSFVKFMRDYEIF